MTTRLHIGIVRPQPGWQLLLDQIGVDWSALVVGDTPSPSQYSAIVVPTRLATTERAALLEYTRAGGALLDAAQAFSSSTLPRPVRTLFPERNDTLFGDIPLLDLFSFVRTKRTAPYLQGTIELREEGNGTMAWLGLPIAQLMLDTRKRRKQFYAPSGHFPNEMVALVSKAAIRLVVTRLLKELHFRRGLPFAHKRFFPEDAPSIFCFRIDSDGGSRAQVESWCSIAHRHAIPMTWFLHMEGYGEWLDVFAQYPKQETGIHAMQHATYDTYEENKRNIQLAREVLDAQGMHYEGYAAPFGTWNTAVALAEEYHGFSYASEFSLCYDDVPFYPWVQERFSPVLQVPIHPICIGSLARAGMTPDHMNNYNQGVIDAKLYAGEPVIMYDHPLHPYTDVLDALFAHANARALPALSFAEYAHWWKQRLAGSFAAQWDGHTTTANFGLPHAAWLEVWQSHTANTLLRPDNTTVTPQHTTRTQPSVPETIRAVRALSKAVWRQSFIDTYNKWRK